MTSVTEPGLHGPGAGGPRVALIGAGYWGANLARNFHQLGALEIIIDPDTERLTHHAQAYPGVATATDIEVALANPDIHAVVIAAPAELHASLAMRCLQADKHVFVEKPIALDLADARAVVDLASQRDRVLMVGHLLHYHPAVERLLDMVDSGELGRIRYVTSNRLNLGKIRTEENALWSFAPHDFSIILRIAGVMPIRVQCTGESHVTAGVADTTLTALQFPEELRAHVHVSWLHPFKQQQLTVVGESGLAQFDDTQPWDRKLTVFRQPVTFTEDAVPQANRSDCEYIDVQEAEPLATECQHFLDCVAHGRTPRTDGREGLRVLTALQAAQSSLELEGMPVMLEDNEVFIHPTAVVDPGASIGQGTRIWHFCHVSAGAVLGERCSLGQNVFIADGVSLGSGCKVQNNVSLYDGVTCADEVFIGPSVVFTNVRNPRAAINRRGQYEPTSIARGVSIGANATIVCGIQLNEGAFIGAGAVVTADVPAYGLVMGVPGRLVGWVSAAGHRLELPVHSEVAMQAACPETGQTYRLLGGALSRIDG